MHFLDSLMWPIGIATLCLFVLLWFSGLIILASLKAGSFFLPFKQLHLAEKYARILLIVTGVSFVLMITLSSFITRQATSEYKCLLTHFSTTQDRIYLNDSLVTLSAPIIKELLDLKHLAPHHSSPGDSIILKIIQNGKASLIKIRRDTRIENEYWVYYPLDYETTRNNEIGNLKSDRLKLFR
jgi:hypothetical protein